MQSSQTALIVVTSVLVLLLLTSVLLRRCMNSYKPHRVVRAPSRARVRLQIPARNLRFNIFLLTLPTSIQRQNTFFKHHNPAVPVEIVYGDDTNKVENAMKYKQLVDPHYFQVALDLISGKTKKRPDTTYFNLGAIGCYFGQSKTLKPPWFAQVKPLTKGFCKTKTMKPPCFQKLKRLT